MIDCVYVLKDNGDAVYGRSFTEGQAIGPESIPPHARACALLLQSSTSARTESSYVLRQNGTLWLYAFFGRFSVVLQSRYTAAQTTLKKLVLSIGHAIVRHYGSTIASWSGDFGDVEGFDSLIESYTSIDLLKTNRHVESRLQETLDRVLESYPVAYAGVLNIVGEMVSGNVPEDHLSHIREEILGETFHLEPDMVPTTLQVFGYDVQVMGVGTYTIAVAPYLGDGIIQAMQAASEIAHAFESLIS